MSRVKIERLADNIDDAGEMLKSGSTLIRRVLFTVGPRVQRLTAVMTGNLRRSEHEVLDSPREGRWTTGVEYMAYQKNDPMLEGLEDAMPEIERVMGDYGDKVMVKVSR